MSQVWSHLKKWTQARIGLPRTGTSLGTDALLAFQLAHALARDAVHSPWNVTQLADVLKAQGTRATILATRATERDVFLKRPDYGRRLGAQALQDLGSSAAVDIAFCVSDGLSAQAIDAHFLEVWSLMVERCQLLQQLSWALFLVPFGRVAVADEISERVSAKLSVMFIGERPGLSVATSMGVYLTYAPRRGTTDASRNCISNIRTPGGLAAPDALRKIDFLMAESLRLKLSGVQLKENAGNRLT